MIAPTTGARSSHCPHNSAARCLFNHATTCVPRLGERRISLHRLPACASTIVTLVTQFKHDQLAANPHEGRRAKRKCATTKICRPLAHVLHERGCRRAAARQIACVKPVRDGESVRFIRARLYVAHIFLSFLRSSLSLPSTSPPFLVSVLFPLCLHRGRFCFYSFLYTRCTSVSSPCSAASSHC